MDSVPAAATPQQQPADQLASYSNSYRAEPVSPSSLTGAADARDDSTSVGVGLLGVRLSGTGDSLIQQQQQHQQYPLTHHMLQTMASFGRHQRIDENDNHDDDVNDRGGSASPYDTKYQLQQQQPSQHPYHPQDALLQQHLHQQQVNLQHQLVNGCYPDYASSLGATGGSYNPMSAAASRYGVGVGGGGGEVLGHGIGSNFSPYGQQNPLQQQQQQHLNHHPLHQYRGSAAGWPTSLIQACGGGGYVGGRGVDSESAGSSTDSVDIKPVIDHRGGVALTTGGPSATFYPQYRGNGSGADTPGAAGCPSPAPSLSWSIAAATAAAAAQNHGNLVPHHHYQQHPGLFQSHYSSYQQQQQQLGSEMTTSYGGSGGSMAAGLGMMSGFNPYGSAAAQQLQQHCTFQSSASSPPLSVHHILRGVYDTLQVNVLPTMLRALCDRLLLYLFYTPFR